MGIKFNFIIREGSGEVRFEGIYEKTNTTSTTETIPSKPIIVKPHTKVKVQTTL